MLKEPKSAYNNIRGDVMPTVFNVIIRPAEDVGGYWAECSMPNGGCTVQEDTLQEIQKSMFEAVALHLEDDFPEITDYLLSFEVRNA